jgi:glutamate-1-semialdehyde 2,1-aminomutase
MFLKEELKNYLTTHPKSREMWNNSQKVLAGGVSHNIRNLGLPSIGAFPPFIQSGRDATVTDVDGITYDDYWGAHYANLLGNNNPSIQSLISQELGKGWHLGTVLEDQVRLADTLIRDNPGLEHVRFCTSGTEATMYATRLARAFTGKKKVVKAKFGWHGAADTLFYNVRAPLTGRETRGIFDEEKAKILSVDINDPSVSEVIKQHSKELAAVIVEPILGGGGGFPVNPDFLRMLREETQQHDILLIFDEVITGYRFSYGLFQNELKILPDITTMGKIIGGGFPVGAVGGRFDIIEQANPTLPDRVWIGGGTFSGYPLSMKAGIEILSILRDSQSSYLRINRLGTSLLKSLNLFFDTEDLPFVATGYKSLITLHVLTRTLDRYDPFEIVHFTDKKKEALTQLALLNRKITGMHGIGALSFAHKNEQIEYITNTIKEIAPLVFQTDMGNN